jgi:DNA-directed RNA polymerase subunit RPC12/RpoP
MQGTCTRCGRRTELEDRSPVWAEHAQTEALQCPHCGQLDALLWIASDADRRSLFAESERRWLARLERQAQTSHSI